MTRNTPLTVKVWGDFACFTRPEFCAERVSYEVMTPSAARGVLEAIFWKPEFVWKILQIKVLKPIKHFSIFRNEVNNVQSDRSAKNPKYHYYADEDRAQRHTLGLRDVGYIIEADIKLKPHANAHPAKYRDQFRRRVKQGRCHHQPYLGTREFSAFFGEPESKDETAKLNDELGLMLLDMQFSETEKSSTIQYLSHDETGAKVTKGKAQPKFFRASLDNGVLRDTRMILSKLKEYAEERMDLPPTMYGENKIAWYIDLKADGKFEGFIPLKSKDAKRGIALITPHIGRSSGVKPKLIADTAEYVLGVGRETSKPERVKECHEQFKTLLQKCAEETEETELQAIAQFLNSSEIEQAKKKLPDGFDPSDVLTFRVVGKIPANAGESWDKIEQFWANYTSGETDHSSDKNNPEMTCLITGETTTVEQRLPFKIKGIIGGQASGTALVSANSSAFMSYGLKNSLTSPISKDAAEKFANALNFLITEPKSHIYFGSTTYVFWTKEPTDLNLPAYFKQPDPQAVANLLQSPHNAKRASGLEANKFFGISLTANNARAVVRDWLETTVPNVETNLKAWFERQKIVDTYGAEYRPLPVYVLAASIYRDASKEMQPNIPTSLMRNALKGDRLPYDLLNKLVRRNRVERNVTYPRAMLTKLILSSDSTTQTMMTDMEQINLNPNLEGCDRSAYYCGRLLAVLEAIQRKAIRKINASLTDRYYGAASSTPANAFSSLMRNARHHLATLRRKDKGACIALEKRLEEVAVNLPTFPKTLNLQQQGLFALGYYHQRASDSAAAKAYKKQQSS